MRARLLLALSLALNIVMLSIIYRDAQAPLPPDDPFAIIRRTNVVTVQSPHNSVVVRRQFFNWNEIESDDYPTFVANLRRIGCPELTIRDIIVADVNQMFAQRRTQEILPADTQWWKSEPDMDQTEVALKKQAELELERTNLLTKLLGPGWNIDFAQPSQPGTVALNGPVLGKLSPETKFAIQQLAAASARRQQDYVNAQRAAGKPLDPVEMAKIRADHRQELSKILAPDQLEEYLLRYSANAESLRTQLKGFNPTPEEFRAIFRARDSIDNNIQLHYSGADATSAKGREELEKMRDDAVASALGPDRAALYRATNDPLFREAQFLAEQSGATPEKVIPLYQVQIEGARERARINSDANLTASQRADAIRAVQVAEEAARRKILGLPAEGTTQ
jgi:hypothetical protein